MKHALNLYRRHRQGCEAGHPTESRSGEFEERKKGWKRCNCFIFASGTIRGKFKRRYTGKSQWDEAKAAVQAWEQARSWDTLVEEAVTPPLPQDKARSTINDATSSFLASRENRGIEASTGAKYRTFVKQLSQYCDSRGYVMKASLKLQRLFNPCYSLRTGTSAKRPASACRGIHSFVISVAG
jgi:hypothetical protein